MEGAIREVAHHELRTLCFNSSVTVVVRLSEPGEDSIVHISWFARSHKISSNFKLNSDNIASAMLGSYRSRLAEEVLSKTREGIRESVREFLSVESK